MSKVFFEIPDEEPTDELGPVPNGLRELNANLGDDLTAGPSATMSVGVKGLPDATKIGTKDFVVGLNKLLRSKSSTWRTSKVLSVALGVDAKDLDAYLKTREDIESKASKSEEGVLLYALKERLERLVPEGKSRPVISEEDRYTLAEINCALSMLERAIKKHGVLISERSPEAFNSFVKGKSGIEGALYLYANALKADLDKL